MNTSSIRSFFLGLCPALLWCALDATAPQDATAPNDGPDEAPQLALEYLEIVTPEMDATCATLEALTGVRFGEPTPELGNARTAPLAGGGRIGVRMPMNEGEVPVWRPYVLVDDIDDAFDTAKVAGVEVMHPPFEIPGQGAFAIYRQGENQFGLWQN